MINKILYMLSLLLCLLYTNSYGQRTIIKYLSGTDKDHTVAWDFYCTSGQNSKKWSTIPVPSCWELQGFGTYNYGRGGTDSHESGIYNYQFNANDDWENKQVNIVFEGAMTDTKVWINGKLAGKKHQGAFYQFKYDITSLLKFGKTNLLKVRVDEKSANGSVNRAERQGDFWIFGGIFRPVYLEILPKIHIKRIAIDAEANGSFSMQIYLKNIRDKCSVEAIIQQTDGGQKSKSFSTFINSHDTLATLKHKFTKVELWSPEFPNLYDIQVYLKDRKGNVLHEINQKFGFRTVELRPHDGFYLNGKKVLFKGVNHHRFWPTSGRTASKRLSIKDVNLMKDMNMNAVRMSHYPPDSYFLDVCDSLGLMVLDELTGWHHYYDDSIGHKLVKEMVVRDVNHPSIVIWDNGNEGGFNIDLDKDFDVYDPQKRLVIHPWQNFNGTNTDHYLSYNQLVNLSLYGNFVYFPTEFLHGLYDGGSGAGLDDYWNLMERAPHSAGGFLWNFSDGGLIRTDEDDSLGTHGNDAPDGILGPYRQKGGSFYTIKQIWSPVHIDQKYITPNFNGELLVENRYLFTNLNQCTFQWRLISFGNPYKKMPERTVDASGHPKEVSIMPGEKKWLNLQLPSSWDSSDALYLTAWNPHHKKIFTWSWPIHSAEYLSKELVNRTNATSNITVKENNTTLIVKKGDVNLYFNKATGYLKKVTTGDKVLSLSGGPALAGVEQRLQSFSYFFEGEDYIVVADYEGDNNWLKAKWTISPNAPAKLSYSFNQKGEADFMGITFNYPKNRITGMKWLGRGPFHVWKNRLKGLKFGIWENNFNNPVGKKSWVYPELKGNFEDVYWAKIKTKESPFMVIVKNSGVFLQMLKPDRHTIFSDRDQTMVNFPKGNIGFMNAIQPIGSKFQKAKILGPQSQKNGQLNAPYEGVIWFDFDLQ